MLIELRSCMNDEVGKPQKHGADMWTRVAAEIAAACDGFDKDSESCRKKWQKVYRVYKDDKMRIVRAAHGHCASNNITLSCKWFHLIDKYVQNIKHAKTHSHTSGTSEIVFLDETTHLDTNLETHESVPAHTACMESSHTAQACDTQGVKTPLTNETNLVDSLRLSSAENQGALQTLPNNGQDHDSHHSDEEDLEGNAKRARREQEMERCLSQMAETWKESLEAMKEADAKRIEVLQSLAVTMAGLLDVLRKW
ncbi:hypothetical protein KP509_09G038800 [Ceratopteris richardii]|nr:hypothetical protein KP509_09G038800 [Ceratopteris richardii]